MMNICTYLHQEDILYIYKKYHCSKRIYHMEKVWFYCSLLSQVFTKYNEIHEHEGNMLKYSALLHDIGYFISKKNHHQYSKDIICKDELFNKVPLELRNLLGIIVASHRKQIDKELHSHCKENQLQVLKVISLLRLADSLDYGDKPMLEDLYIKDNALYLNLNTAPKYKAMIKIHRKAELLRHIFQLKVILQ